VRRGTTPSNSAPSKYDLLRQLGDSVCRKSGEGGD